MFVIKLKGLHKMSEIEELLKEQGQEHLIKYIEMADEEQRERLINEIKNLDFDKFVNINCLL